MEAVREGPEQSGGWNETRECVEEEGVRLLKCYFDLPHFLLGGRLASAPPSRGPSCLDLPVSPPAACFRGLRRSGKGGEGLAEKSGPSPLSQGVGRLLSMLRTPRM